MPSAISSRVSKSCASSGVLSSRIGSEVDFAREPTAMLSSVLSKVLRYAPLLETFSAVLSRVFKSVLASASGFVFS